MTGSALYLGSVTHRRLRPRPHAFRYRVFWMLLDLDELDMLDRRLRWFSRNRFNLSSFRDRDHGAATGSTLRRRLEAKLTVAGLGEASASLKLFCMPRVLGYDFNPISICLCHRLDGSLGAVLYEVRNTFGGRHDYLFPVSRDRAPFLEQHCRKTLHVSPFLDMDMRYRFRLSPPGERMALKVVGSGAQGPEIVAALEARRAPLTDRTLLAALASFPLVSLKVIAGIHWQAFRMLTKGFVVHDHAGLGPASTGDRGAAAE